MPTLSTQLPYFVRQRIKYAHQHIHEQHIDEVLACLAGELQFPAVDDSVDGEVGGYGDEEAEEEMPEGDGLGVEGEGVEKEEDGGDGVDGIVHELDFAPDGNFVFLGGLIGHIVYYKGTCRD